MSDRDQSGREFRELVMNGETGRGSNTKNRDEEEKVFGHGHMAGTGRKDDFSGGGDKVRKKQGHFANEGGMSLAG